MELKELKLIRELTEAKEYHDGLNPAILPHFEKMRKALIGKKVTAFGKKSKGMYGQKDDVQTYVIKNVVLEKNYSLDNDANVTISLTGYNSKGGLLYTDTEFLNSLKALLLKADLLKNIKSIGYSEHGMQGNTTVNLDIGFKKMLK